MKYFIAIFLLLFSSIVYADRTLRWLPPDQNTDGTAFNADTEGKEYRLYCWQEFDVGTGATPTILPNSPGLTAWQMLFPLGVNSCNLSIVNNSDVESDPSGAVTFVESPECLDCIDLSLLTFVSYKPGEQDMDSDFSVTSNAIVLKDNTWVNTAALFVIAADTVLSFDFESSQAGEYHGIGFLGDGDAVTSLEFNLFGSQGQPVMDFRYSGSGVDSFTIPVGTYTTGNFKLVFISDDDSGPGMNGAFSNIRLSTAAPSVPLPPTNISID